MFHMIWYTTFPAMAGVITELLSKTLCNIHNVKNFLKKSLYK